MKKVMTGFILIGIVLSGCNSQSIHCEKLSIERELQDIHEKDQNIRRELMPILGKYQADGSGKLKLMMLALKMERQDQENQEYLLELFKRCGWPEDLNREAHSTIYLVLQHSPDSIMREYYPMVEAFAAKGFLDPDDPATMYDRLLMNAGKPQRYGTQTFADNKNRNLLWPVGNSDSLEIHRADVGLPPMETYFQIAKDSMKIEMIWDKDLTIDEAKEMKSN